jgi:hypothetical protein
VPYLYKSIMQCHSTSIPFSVACALLLTLVVAMSPAGLTFANRAIHGCRHRYTYCRDLGKSILELVRLSVPIPCLRTLVAGS